MQKYRPKQIQISESDLGLLQYLIHDTQGVFRFKLKKTSREEAFSDEINLWQITAQGQIK